MKKITLLLFAIVLTLVLTGCEQKVTTATCTIKQNNALNTFKFSATNDEIDKVDLTMVIDNSAFGVDSLSTLSDKQKELVKTNMMRTLGLREEKKYKGFEFNVEIKDEMTITINADLKTADPVALKRVGMDFTGADMSLKKAIKDLEASGATCK